MMKNRWIIVVAIVMLAAAGVLAEKETAGKPAWDAVYPMANAKISWMQTYYPHP